MWAHGAHWPHGLLGWGPLAQSSRCRREPHPEIAILKDLRVPCREFRYSLASETGVVSNSPVPCKMVGGVKLCTVVPDACRWWFRPDLLRITTENDAFCYPATYYSPSNLPGVECVRLQHCSGNPLARQASQPFCLLNQSSKPS